VPLLYEETVSQATRRFVTSSAASWLNKNSRSRHASSLSKILPPLHAVFTETC